MLAELRAAQSCAITHTAGLEETYCSISNWQLTERIPLFSVEINLLNECLILSVKTKTNKQIHIYIYIYIY